MILKVLLLFVAVIHGVSIVVKTAYQEPILSIHILLFTIGTVGFLTLQYNLLEVGF